MIPKIIRMVLIIIPISLEIALKVKVSMNFLKSKGLGYPYLYLRQGEQKVLKSKGTEKQSKPNLRQFFQPLVMNLISSTKCHSRYWKTMLFIVGIS